jgi:hypothetical protein
MSVEFSAEARLLAEDERDPVRRSHYPGLEERTHSELVELARFFRGVAIEPATSSATFVVPAAAREASVKDLAANADWPRKSRCMPEL